MDPRYVWPTGRLAEALSLLARRCGRRGADPGRRSPAAPAEDSRPAATAAHIEALAAEAGFEAEAVTIAYGDLEPTLRRAAPALLRFDAPGRSGWLVLVGGGRRHRRLLGPDRRLHRVGTDALRQALCAGLEATAGEGIEDLLGEAGLSASRRARGAVLRARLGAEAVGGIWLLRLPPSAPLPRQLRWAGLGLSLGLLLGGHILQYGLWLAAWWTVGAGALDGRLGSALPVWGLLLATWLPVRLATTWLQGHLALSAGALLKRRLLLGALRQRLDAVRCQGVGQLLGRVLESSAVEALAIGGGAQAAIAVVELALAAVVLALGSGGGLHAAVLVAWLGVTAALGSGLYRRQAVWTADRLRSSHRLIEGMVGHRTRLAQGAPEHRHRREDAELAAYLAAAGAMDQASARIQAVVPRGWLVVGVAALTPAFLAGSGAGGLAVALGGTILAYQAFERLAGLSGAGLAGLGEAALAGRQVAGLFHAAAGEPVLPAAPAQAPAAPPSRGEPVLEAHDIRFRYPSGSGSVLRGASLTLRAGERLLLEGPSGGGKSTLVSLLSGLRAPAAGLLLCRGLDPSTLGPDGWRRRVAAAPQFHQNHILTGTLAFNLLMGRRWPPEETDLEEAEALCRRLGLGSLLERMPAGLMQMVGETGWQLSHGEKSRVFLARALLQGADAVILDESFAALDPENRVRALGVTLEEAPALLVVDHP